VYQVAGEARECAVMKAVEVGEGLYAGGDVVAGVTGGGGGLLFWWVLLDLV
jgi:hypothetical protein